MASPTPPNPPTDLTAVAKLIREELDRNNKYMEFAQSQIEKDRSFYKFLVSAVGLAFVVAGYFATTSVNQMRSDAKTSVDTEVQRDKAEVAAFNAEAQATVQKELSNVRIEVQKRLDTEFQSDNIKEQIAVAARDRTAKELTGIIRSETSAQVAVGIKDQQPFIKTTVEDAARGAVKALQSTIDALVSKATETQVSKTVTPIQAQMATYADYIRVGTLATLANGDDRHAFDTLLQIATGQSKDSSNPEFAHLANSTLATIISAKESGFRLTRQFNQKQTNDSLKQIMRNPSPWDREAALDNYPPDDRSILPLLVEMIRNDDSIDVLVRAVQHFDALTKQSFRFIQVKELLDWWTINQKSFQ